MVQAARVAEGNQHELLQAYHYGCQQLELQHPVAFIAGEVR